MKLKRIVLLLVIGVLAGMFANNPYGILDRTIAVLLYVSGRYDNYFLIGAAALTLLMIVVALIASRRETVSTRKATERILNKANIPYKHSLRRRRFTAKRFFFAVILLAALAVGWYGLMFVPIVIRWIMVGLLTLAFIILKVRKLHQPAVETLGHITVQEAHKGTEIIDAVLISSGTATGSATTESEERSATDEPETPPRSTTSRLSAFASFIRDIADSLRGLLRGNPETVRSKAEARVKRIRARGDILHNLLTAWFQFRLTLRLRKIDQINARAAARVSKTQAKANAKERKINARGANQATLLSRWLQYRLDRLQKKIERIKARADARIRKIEAKTAAYERRKRARADYEQQTGKEPSTWWKPWTWQLLRRKIVFGRPRLLLIAIPLAAMLIGIAMHANWLWPLLLWLTIRITVYSTIGWKMKTLNFTAVSAWAILVIAYFTM